MEAMLEGPPTRLKFDGTSGMHIWYFQMMLHVTEMPVQKLKMTKRWRAAG